MALISCPECTWKVSDKAPTCPQCGCPIGHSEIRSPTQMDSETLKHESSEYTQKPIEPDDPNLIFTEMRGPSPLAKVIARSDRRSHRGISYWVVTFPIALVVYIFGFYIIPLPSVYASDTTPRFFICLVVTAILCGVIGSILNRDPNQQKPTRFGTHIGKRNPFDPSKHT